MIVEFQIAPRFAPHVISGRKRQLIVTTLKCTPGDKLVILMPAYLAEGLRYTTIEEICISIQTLKFSPTAVILDGSRLTVGMADKFAHDQGFIDLKEMSDCYRIKNENSIFDGFVIKW